MGKDKTMEVVSKTLWKIRTEIEVVRKALENGANIEAENENGQTPAEYAASKKEYTIAEIISHYKDELEIIKM